MTAEELVREGRLDEALAALKDRIRKDPATAKHRIFLFQLLAVMGDWDRAMNQLNVLGDMDAGSLMMVQAYRAGIQAEVFRADIYAGKRSPLVFGEPEEWIALLIEALRVEADGKLAEGRSLRDKAFEAAPTTSGKIKAGDAESVAFDWIADADARLGPMLEAIVEGKIYWIPFHRVAEIHLEAPTDLRDMVWSPAQFTWANGGVAVGFIPVRYPGSEASDDSKLRLARKTDWKAIGDDAYHGLGQRMFATDVDEHALLDVRTIELDTREDDAGSESTDG